MGTIKTSGIIISESNLGDYDKMLTMLTPGLGKISCVAKGARRPRSALLAGTQLFCFGEYMMYKGTNTYNINSCSTIEVFYNVRIDLDKLNYVAEITRLIQDTTTENQNSYNILQLLLNTIYVISETDKNLDLVMSIFKLRLISILGFKPHIEKCTNCGEKENIKYFSLRDNGLKCEVSGKQDKSAVEINEGTLNAIKYAILAPAKKLYSFKVSEESIRELKIISKLYINDKLDKEYKI